jgi:tetratricopeptide (TPR) repeat protein
MRYFSNLRLTNKISSHITILLLFFSLVDTSIAQNIQQQLRTADALVNNHYYESALNLYQKIYNSDNRNLSAITGIKKCLTGLQVYGRLITFLEDALKSQPAGSPLYTDLGEAYFLNDEREKAFSVWYSHLERNSNNIGVYRLVAMAMIRQRLYDEAIEVYKNAIKRLKKQETLYVDIANLYKAQLNYEKASEYYLQYYHAKPKQIAFLQRQLLSLSDKGDDIAPIVNAINSFLIKHPEQDKVREILAGLYLKDKDYDQAFAIYQSLETEKSNGTYIQKYALEALGNKAYPNAIIGFEYLMQNYPTSPLVQQAYYNLGRSYAFLAYSMNNSEESAQNMQKAEKIYHDIINSDEKSPLAFNSYINLADIYFKYYFDLDKAIINYQYYLKYNTKGKTRDRVLILLGDTYLTKSQMELALKTYQLVNHKDYLNISKFKTAEVYFYSAELKKAEKSFSQLLSNTKSNDPLMNNILARWMLLKTSTEDSNSFSRYAQADLLKFQKKYALSAEEFEELSRSDNIYRVQAGINASKLYSQLGEYEESKILLMRLKKETPDDKDIDEIIFLLAETEENLKNLDTALEFYHQLLTQYPNSLLIHRARERARLLNIELNNDQS